MLLLIVLKKTTFQEDHMAAGENIVFHTDTRPGCEGFQSNCCNKLPINEAALFSQLMPDAECATPFADCISLLSCFLIPFSVPAPHHILSTSLANQCGRHATAWLKARKQILAVQHESLGPQWTPHDLHAQSALTRIVAEEAFRSCT